MSPKGDFLIAKKTVSQSNVTKVMEVKIWHYGNLFADTRNCI